MKKGFAFLLAGVLACSCFTGCGGAKDSGTSAMTQEKDSGTSAMTQEDVSKYADAFEKVVTIYAQVHWLEQSPGSCLVSSLNQYNTTYDTTYGAGNSATTNTAYETIVSCLEAEQYGEIISADVMAVLKDSEWAAVYSEGTCTCVYWSPSIDSTIWSAKQKINGDFEDIPSDALESASTFESCIKSEQKRQQQLIAQEEMVSDTIIDIMCDTRVYKYYAGTIGNLLPYVFSDYKWSYEPLDGEDSTYIVNVHGSYYATYGTNVVYDGEISYKVNIDTGTCEVYDDPNMINKIMIVFAGEM